MLIRSLCLALAATLAAGSAAAADKAAPAAAQRFDAGTLSGLGARNIGSATMSGRVAAVAAVNEPSGKLTLYVGAASGVTQYSGLPATCSCRFVSRSPPNHIGRTT